jgi:gamma-glutamyl:cysteine ligase YbdK (ATP-grasp superfamily)
MANKLEKIAEKKRQAALEKQEQDVAAFARRVADEVTGNITVDTTNDLKESVVELATSVAQCCCGFQQNF